MEISPLENFLILANSLLIKKNNELEEEVKVLKKKNERLNHSFENVVDDDIDIGGAQGTE